MTTEKTTAKIWVDADGCPKAVKEILFRAADRVRIETCFVANRPVHIPKSHWISRRTVAKGFDVADHVIVEHLQAGDLVITTDVPLAALAIEKGATVITPHGELMTEDNVRERLSFRDFFQDLRDSGVQTGGPPPFGETDKRRFAAALDQHLAQLQQPE